jgi:hypothetical protein
MDTSSEYTFPIFISSTDYNLKDLRAELARFLSELGYKPILSSAEGFPDSSPILEPWESCLPVLDKCFVMILIIDGQYGTALKWPNYKEFFEEEKYSPTHGEYIFAHKIRMRMFVFIRKSLMPHYQSYRTTLGNFENDKEKAKKALDPTLPSYVTFETLDFINKVKTTKPIPWITEFDDITCVKKEIQKKMLNELAELFLIKNKHVETVMDSFNKLMDSLSLEEQKKALAKINATKEIIDAVEKLEGFKNDIEKEKVELEKKKTANTKEKVEKKISELSKKIIDLENETLNSPNSQFFIKDGQIKIGNPNYIDNNLTLETRLYNSATFEPIKLTANSLYLYSKKCDECGKPEYDRNSSLPNMELFNICPSCNRTLCYKCWPRTNLLTSTISLSSMTDKCPECTKKRK